MQKIDVEEIMKEIRQNNTGKNFSEKDISFAAALNQREDYNRSLFNEKYDYMRLYHNNPVYFPLEGSSLKVLVQKIIRRLLRFVNYSAFQYQNNFNEAAYICIDETNKKIKQLEYENLMQQKRIDKLEKEIHMLRKTN